MSPLPDEALHRRQRKMLRESSFASSKFLDQKNFDLTCTYVVAVMAQDEATVRDDAAEAAIGVVVVAAAREAQVEVEARHERRSSRMKASSPTVWPPLHVL